MGRPAKETVVALVAADSVRAGSRGEDVWMPGGTEGCDPPPMSDSELRRLLENLRLRAQMQRMISEDTPASVATTSEVPSAAAPLPTTGGEGMPAGHKHRVVEDLSGPLRVAGAGAVLEEDLVDFEDGDDA